MPFEQLQKATKDFREWKQTHGIAEASRIAMNAFPQLICPNKEKFTEGKMNFREFDNVNNVGRMLYGEGWDSFRRFGSVSTFQEAGEVTSSLFTAINSSVALQGTLQAYEEDMSENPLVNAIPVIPCNNLVGGRRGRYEEAASSDITVAEAAGPTYVQLSQFYTTDPALSKTHVGMKITREALIEEQVGGLVAQAQTVGKRIARYKRDRLLQVMFQRDIARGGYTTVRSGTQTISYIEDGVTRKTYYVSGDAGPWTNELGSNALVDYTDLDAAKALFDAMTDPGSGQHISVMPRHLAVMPAKAMLAQDLVSSIQRKTIASTEYSVVNPYSGLQVFSLPVARDILTAGGVGGYTDESEARANLYWLYGDFSKAFGMLQAAPLSPSQPFELTTESGGNGSSGLFWEADIMYAAKAVWIGNPFIQSPRHVVMCYDVQTANVID